MTMDLLSAFTHTPLCKQPTLPHSPLEWHSFFSFSTSCFSFNLRLPLNKNSFLIKMVYNHISNPNAPPVSTEGISQHAFQTAKRDTILLGLHCCTTHMCRAMRKPQDLAQVLSPLGSSHWPMWPEFVLPWASPQDTKHYALHATDSCADFFH